MKWLSRPQETGTQRSLALAPTILQELRKEREREVPGFRRPGEKGTR